MLRRAVLPYLRQLLAVDDTPERTALAFTIGVFLAFSPLVGLHTFLGLGVAFLFGLNRVAVLLGVFVNNPWTLVPIYAAATYVGGIVVGFPAQTSLPDIGWKEFWNARFWWELLKQWRFLKQTLLGSLILSVVAATLSYPVALYLLKQTKSYREHRRALPRP